MSQTARLMVVSLAMGLSACSPTPAPSPPKPTPPAEGPPAKTPPAKSPPAKPPSKAPEQNPPAPSPPKNDAAPKPSPGMKEAFPHVRVDQAARVVEIDGIVPIDVHNKETPDVYLEVTVCTRDSKEHESLVMTEAKPSDVHAALLLLRLKPGKPGSVEFDGKTLQRTPPTGDGLTVSIAYKDAKGNEVETPATDWIVSAGKKAPFKLKAAGPAWVFAGSRFVTHNGKEWYDADGAGTLVGLTTFGGETVACVDVLSPESSVDEPEWIADASKVPPFGTPVVVRIRPAK